MPLATPLDSYPLARTSNVDELRASLARIYTKPIMEPVGETRGLKAVVNHCQLEKIGLSYGSFGIAARWDFPDESDSFLQLFPLKGMAEFVVDGASVAINADNGVLVSANTGFSMENDVDYERVILIIDRAALENTLSTIIGKPIGSSLKMIPTQDYRQPSARALREHFMFLVGQLSVAPPPPPLVLADFEQMLMVMFLRVNQHNYSHLLERDSLGASAWQVRRAEGYIEANWNRPMSMEAIAAETGVDVLSLFRSFRRSRDCSPMEFLVQVRLRHAREMLRYPDKKTTIAEVASTCGFAGFGDFGEKYFRAFGEQPLQTLNRAGGADPVSD